MNTNIELYYAVPRQFYWWYDTMNAVYGRQHIVLNQ
jgi:hypothetical protein